MKKPVWLISIFICYYIIKIAYFLLKLSYLPSFNSSIVVKNPSHLLFDDYWAVIKDYLCDYSRLVWYNYYLQFRKKLEGFVLANSLKIAKNNYKNTNKLNHSIHHSLLLKIINLYSLKAYNIFKISRNASRYYLQTLLQLRSKELLIEKDHILGND